jgi:hypothetical protein
MIERRFSCTITMTCRMLLMPISGSIGGSNDGSGEVDGTGEAAAIARSPEPPAEGTPPEHAAPTLAAIRRIAMEDSGRPGNRPARM